MLSFIASAIVSALLAGNVSTSAAPIAWSNDSLRIKHAAEVVSVDRGLTYLETEDGNVGAYIENWTQAVFTLSCLILAAQTISKMTVF